jgi:N-acetyl-gamma-glutamyl-phosphate reductase
MTAKIFIDGEVGTTGLQIRQRLSGRRDVELISIPEAERKDAKRRAQMLNGADLAILCLPDDAAREAVSLISNPETRIIDASTAHRTTAGWVYGMPEWDDGQGARIGKARRVANPGCYALASVAMLHPLVTAGLLPADHPVAINAVSGYSGGGRKMIASFEDKSAPDYTEAPFRVYGLGLEHKHVDEIQAHGSLTRRPLFVPSVGRFAQGMIVQLPLQLDALPSKPKGRDVHGVLAKHYRGRPLVSVADLDETAAMTGLEPEALNGTDGLRLHVFANDRRGHAVVMALLDNLGKGAAGQAVQNMNLMLGIDEMAGLKPAPAA